MNGYWQLFGRCISINDALYLSTITRAGGLLLGAGFAMVWRPMAIVRGPLRNRSASARPRRLPRHRRASALMMWRFELTEPGTNFGVRYDPWLFRGGFLWVGLATLMVIAAVTHQATLLGRFLGNPLLNWIGTRSYGLYLFHWPIYQIIRTYAGVPLTGAQFVLAMAITVPITELSYRFVETPIRKGRLGEWWRARHDIRRRAAGPPARQPPADLRAERRRARARRLLRVQPRHGRQPLRRRRRVHAAAGRQGHHDDRGAGEHDRPAGDASPSTDATATRRPDDHGGGDDHHDPEAAPAAGRVRRIGDEGRAPANSSPAASTSTRRRTARPTQMVADIQQAKAAQPARPGRGRPGRHERHADRRPDRRRSSRRCRPTRGCTS